MDYCIETFGLTKDFGAFRAVDGLGLQVERGSFYGFLGPNGAGKSTTIKMLTGLMGSSGGSARILGHDMAKAPLEIKKHIGVVPEDLCLFENLTAREYLVFIGRMYLVAPKLVNDRCEELLALMGLSDTGKTLVLEFSTGMRKKLALAAALIHDPDLLFLDEPFEGIDAIASRTIRNVLEQIIHRGSTIFLTSHILEIVERLCTHVGIIRQGKLAAQGSLESLSQGSSLEETFIRTVGEGEHAPVSLSWLEANH
ncbi:MAG: ABC transporter ATP-binding protein [Candidatus Hydrogenedentes bacterium]|nr:ABC transporter ATP-binding protein [Candidatus Hydrogenedentota bacterium]